MKEKEKNKMEIRFKALSINESFARASVAGFCLQINPTLDELTDIKTAVSEAVTNSVVHEYSGIPIGDVVISVTLFESSVKIEVKDFGIGIENFTLAKQPFYTSKPDQERSGIGFTVMESFMDSLELENNPDGGLKVTLFKKIKDNEQKAKKLG
ncbi:MAG: anti-sigma F factor [Clostridia bacterium]|nr:anti-sigma F factor [Clostridia bacterium]